MALVRWRSRPGTLETGNIQELGICKHAKNEAINDEPRNDVKQVKRFS